MYWQVGEYISKKIKTAGWGKSVVKQLADYLKETQPDLKGFNERSLWRMKQFYETYIGFPKLSALLTEISWTNNLMILSKIKSIEEKEFYIRLSIKEKYSSRELERQINSGYFERTMLSNKKLSTMLRELPWSSNMHKKYYICNHNQIHKQNGVHTI